MKPVLLSAENVGIKDGFDYFLNGLRAFAVAVVVLFHFGVPGFLRGFLGVDIFFVLSGFVMMAIADRYLIDGKVAIGKFFKARFLRLYPALCLVITVAILGSALTLFPEDLKRTGLHGLQSAGFVSNFGFWREAGYFDAAKDFKPLLHTWSLSVEWQFYLFWPIALALFGRSQKTAMILVLLTAGLSAGLALAFSQYSNFSFYMMPLRAWEFLAGVMACWVLTDYGPKLRTKEVLCNCLGYLSLLFIVIGLCAPSPTTPEHLWFLRILTVIGVAGILVGRPKSLSPLVQGKLLTWLGKISYSLYLWHWPLYILLLNYVEAEPNGFQIVALLLVSIFFAQLSFSLIEAPAREEKRFLSARFLIPSAFAVPLALSVWLGDGWSWRYSDSARETMSFFQEERLTYQESYGRIFPLGKETEWTRSKHFGLGCLLDKLEFQTNGRSLAISCLLGNLDVDAESKKYIVIGDSNGKNVHEALQLAFPQYRFSFLMYSGCAPAEYDGCFKGLPNIIEQIKDKVSLDGVVLASRFANQDWIMTEKTMNVLRSYELPVVIFGATPTLKRQLAFAMIRTGQPIGEGQISLPYDPLWFYTDGDDADRYFEDQAATHPNWYFVPKKDAFCSDSICSFSDEEGKKPWYSDDQHLTLDGIRRLSSWLRDNAETHRFFDNSGWRVKH